MSPTPISADLAAPLNIVAARGVPFGRAFDLTLPAGDHEITDARFWTFDEDVEPAAVFIDDELPRIVVSWTDEETAAMPLRTVEYVLMVALDDAPLEQLVAGRLSWTNVQMPGTSTPETVPITVYLGDNVITIVTTFAGPQGPPTADAVIGDGITRIEAITQAAYDLLSPPDPTTFYVITA